MKEWFMQVPEALQKRIMICFAIAVLFIILFFVTLFGFGDLYLYSPCLFFAILFIISTIWLLYNSIKSNYVSVSGVCTHIEVSPIRKRIKSIILEYEDETPKQLTIPIRERMKRLAVGDTVIVYLSKKAPVYNRDGGYLIYSYYAIEIRKGA